MEFVVVERLPLLAQPGFVLFERTERFDNLVCIDRLFGGSFPLGGPSEESHKEDPRDNQKCGGDFQLVRTDSECPAIIQEGPKQRWYDENQHQGERGD